MSFQSSQKQVSWVKLAASGLIAIQGTIAATAISEIIATTPGTSLVRVAAAQDESKVAENLIRQVGPAVVYIETDQARGSGVIIEANGLIATNAHVIKGARQINVELPDGRKYKAEVISEGSGDCLDLALLKVEATNLPKAKLASPGSVQRGQRVFAIGYPRGIKPSSITQGIVSNVHHIPGLIQTDTTLIPGNSGGALLNSRGELVAVNTSKGTGENVGMNFAVSIDKVQMLVQAHQQGISPIIGQLMVPATVQPGQALAQNLSLSGTVINGRFQAGSNVMCRDGSYANLYTFQAKAYDPVMLEMTSPGAGSYMLLLGPDGNVVAMGKAKERSQTTRIIEALPSTGTYTLVANSTKSTPSAQYRLRASSPLLVVRDRLDSSTPPCMKNGSPCRSYNITGKANQEIVIALHQFDFNPYLAVIDGKGNVIARGKAERQDVVKVALPKDGDYRLVVSTVDPADRGPFFLSVHTATKVTQPRQASRNQ